MNYSEAEKKLHNKYSVKIYNQRPDVKERNRKRALQWRHENIEKAREADSRFYKNHKSERISASALNNSRPCKDPILGDTVRYNTLVVRIRNHPELYGDISPKDYLIHIPKIKGLDLLTEQQKKDLNV